MNTRTYYVVADDDAVDEGSGLMLGLGLTDGDGVGVAEADGLGLGDGLGEGETDGLGLILGLTEALTAGFFEGFAEGEGDGVGVGVSVGVGLGDGELVSPKTCGLEGKKIDLNHSPEPNNINTKTPDSRRVGFDGLFAEKLCLLLKIFSNITALYIIR